MIKRLQRVIFMAIFTGFLIASTAQAAPILPHRMKAAAETPYRENELIIRTNLPLSQLPANGLTAKAVSDRTQIRSLFKGFSKADKLERVRALSQTRYKPRKHRRLKPKADYFRDQMQNLYHLKVSPGTDIHALISEWKTKGLITFGEPNFIYRLNSITPNDAYFYRQDNLQLIRAPEAWATTAGAPTCVIAVIDTGVDYYHPDLVANIWHHPVTGDPGYDFVNTTVAENRAVPGEDYAAADNDPMDVHGHGTHIAGIIAAEANNHIGIAGTAYNCQIMPLRAGYSEYDETLQAQGYFDLAGIVSSIHYAVDNDADVINMSFGAVGVGANSTAMENAVNYALSHDVVCVAAAGNDSQSLSEHPNYPAMYAGVICVSAVSNTGVFETSYSNYGNRIDIAAPGGHLDNIEALVEGIISTLPRGSDGSPRYGEEIGTSMATPHVAAAAGMLRAIYPELSADAIRNLLLNSTRDAGTPGKDAYYGYGILDIYNAIDRTPPTIQFSAVSTGNWGVTNPLPITATDNAMSERVPTVSVYYRLLAGSVLQGAWTKLSARRIDETHFTCNLPAAGKPVSHIQYYIEANDDNKGNSVTAPSDAPANWYTMQLLDTLPPKIAYLNSNNFQMMDQDVWSIATAFTLAITDNTGNFSWSTVTLNVAQGGLNASVTFPNAALLPTGSINLSAPAFAGLHSGPAQITVSARDVSGNTGIAGIQLILQTDDAEFELYGASLGAPVLNAPNPFNPLNTNTVFGISNTRIANIQIRIYDMYRHLVRLLDYPGQLIGYHEFVWDGKDESGTLVPSGIYPAIIFGEADSKKIIKKTKLAVIR